MSPKARKSQKMDPNDIISFVRAHEDPAVTAAEIADKFDATPAGARYRLQQLKESGEIAEKRVGASAKIWYLKG